MFVLVCGLRDALFKSDKSINTSLFERLQNSEGNVDLTGDKFQHQQHYVNSVNKEDSLINFRLNKYCCAATVSEEACQGEAEGQTSLSFMILSVMTLCILIIVSGDLLEGEHE